AMTIFESQAQPIDSARLAPVLDTVNRLSSPAFHLEVETFSIGDLEPPVNRLYQRLEAWVHALDVSAVSGPPAAPTRVLRWRHQGWDLRFTPIPRPSRERGPGGSRTAGVYPGGRGSIDD